jgi:putative transposase
MVTAGNIHDLEGARNLLAMGHKPKRVLADRAYDARSLREDLALRRIKAVIPPNPARKHPHRYDKAAHKGRNVIERMFCRLKDFRRIATRYDKRADVFLSAVLLAAALIWWINWVRTLVLQHAPEQWITIRMDTTCFRCNQRKDPCNRGVAPQIYHCALKFKSREGANGHQFFRTFVVFVGFSH